MRNMKVAIVDHVGVKAGMESYDMGLYASFEKAGFAPTVFSNFSVQEKGKQILGVFKFRLHSSLLSLGELLLTYVKVAGQIKSLEISSCIVHGFRFGFAEWMMVRILKRTSAKVLMIVHDPESLIGGRSQSFWRKKIFSMCKALVVHNQFSYDEMKKQCSEAEIKKLFVIPHGNFADEGMINFPGEIGEEFILPQDKKILLFFGQVKESKGLDVLLQALAQTDKSVFLIIAGRMRKHSFSDYEELIRQHHLQDRVMLFIRYISPRMRNQMMHASHAVVLPYRKVFQSGVLLMAMSFGKAVIASDLPPNAEIITDGVNGFLFPAGDSKALAEKINFVLSNDGLREKVSGAGWKDVQTNHSWDSIIQKWITMLNS